MVASDKPASAEIVPLRPRGKCPICGKPSDRRLHPFCSKRCADIDLNRWLSGKYVIPSREEAPGSDEDDGSESA